MARQKKPQPPPDRSKDMLACPGESYLIERAACEARRRRQFKRCTRCPENTDQISLFESPRQVLTVKKKTRRRPRKPKL